MGVFPVCRRAVSSTGWIVTQCLWMGDCWEHVSQVLWVGHSPCPGRAVMPQVTEGSITTCCTAVIGLPLLWRQSLPGLCVLSLSCLLCPMFWNLFPPSITYQPWNVHLFLSVPKILRFHLPLNPYTSPQVSDFKLKLASGWSCQLVISVARPAAWWSAGALSPMLHQKKLNGSDTKTITLKTVAGSVLFIREEGDR